MKDILGRENRKLSDKACAECGKVFKPVRASSKYCSNPCRWKNNGGHNKKPESWWKNSKGYIEGRIWLEDGTQIRVKQHRFVAEGVIGRPLRADEDVHHKDGNKSNNDPSNLEIISHSDHTKLTNSERDYVRGYKMNLSEDERKARSFRAIAMGLDKMGRAERWPKAPIQVSKGHPRRKAKICPCGIGPNTHSHNQPEPKRKP